ncbi:hypothetical protein AVEN_154223-1 [Araneus ventricosus]|uniref:Histone-lysine N-methyltransferase SETMAR n=1 Tax=Araneus ventricosus TaxID=182803 RepID=A0A4Y2GUT1_ARAVE|nr:hypothetical protein AVEN_154223-1 [Araneus ventricosus]
MTMPGRIRPQLRMLWLEQRFQWELLEHPPYNPDLEPRYFRLFGLLKKHLGGPHYRTDTEVQQVILSRLHDLDADLSYTGFNTLVPDSNFSLQQIYSRLALQICKLTANLSR